MSKPKVKMYNWETKFPNTVVGGQVTVSDEEVRVWICENGISVFRLKVLGGKIHLLEYGNGKQVEIMVTKEGLSGKPRDKSEAIGHLEDLEQPERTN